MKTANAKSKANYVAPTLSVFGSVRNLTGGSNGAVGDGGIQSMAMSDMRAKENIVQIGNHPAGFGLYQFDYKAQYRDQCGHGRQFGVMAQEVANFVPDAVVETADGYLNVNYAMLGITQH